MNYVMRMFVAMVLSHERKMSCSLTSIDRGALDMDEKSLSVTAHAPPSRYLRGPSFIHCPVLVVSCVYLR
jgi:hypothetical protein